jgi:hypothetical protein
LRPRSPANDEVYIPAAALGADEPLAPIQNRDIGTVPFNEFGSTWCLQPRHQTIRRSSAFAASPSVIGGPAHARSRSQIGDWLSAEREGLTRRTSFTTD